MPRYHTPAGNINDATEEASHGYKIMVGLRATLWVEVRVFKYPSPATIIFWTLWRKEYFLWTTCNDRKIRSSGIPMFDETLCPYLQGSTFETLKCSYLQGSMFESVLCPYLQGLLGPRRIFLGSIDRRNLRWRFRYLIAVEVDSSSSLP